MRQIDTHTSQWARAAFEAGQKASVLDLALRPPLTFLHDYLLRGGLWRGAAGLTASLFAAYSAGIGLAKLAELCTQSDRPPP